MPKYIKAKVLHTQDKQHISGTASQELCCHCHYPEKPCYCWPPRVCCHTLTTNWLPAPLRTRHYLYRNATFQQKQPDIIFQLTDAKHPVSFKNLSFVLCRKGRRSGPSTGESSSLGLYSEPSPGSRLESWTNIKPLHRDIHDCPLFKSRLNNATCEPNGRLWIDLRFPFGGRRRSKTMVRGAGLKSKRSSWGSESNFTPERFSFCRCFAKCMT